MQDLVWFEFQFADEEADGNTTHYVVARLQAVLDIALRLYAAGWPTKFTLTGVAFAVFTDDEAEVADQLAKLGIAEPFTATPSRTLVEVCDKFGKLNNRARYAAGLAYLRWLENRFGRERPDVGDPFDAGFFLGWLVAIRWVLGSPGNDPSI